MSYQLYLECYAGISGDMVVAALLDLGADAEKLNEVLKNLSADGFTTKISRVKKAGLDACDFNVILDHDHENHDHDMEYLHGGSVHKHHHHQKDGHPEHHHHHEHRSLPDILEILEKSKMNPKAREVAEKIFRILASAEAKAHGTTVEQVHFHEVGAVDSIVDIVAVAVCLEDLKIDQVIIPVLYEGTGFIRCQHGVIPVPVPATANIAKDHRLTLHMTDTQGEFVTPTGAAIAAAIRTSDQLPKEFSIEKIGIGAGKRNYERPSILRAMLIEEKSEKKDCIYKLESNIDDCTGEALGYVMERLLEEGARDVHYHPVYMKKNRPAYQLNVICTKDKIEKLEEIIFAETTTIGIRRQQMERSILKREIQNVETSLGNAQVKVCCLGSGTRIYPEYSSVIELCRKHGKAYQDVYRLIERESYGRI